VDVEDTEVEDDDVEERTSDLELVSAFDGEIVAAEWVLVMDEVGVVTAVVLSAVAIELAVEVVELVAEGSVRVA